MMMQKINPSHVPLLVVVVLALVGNSAEFFYYMDSTERCFEEELTETVSLKIEYSVKYHDSKTDKYVTSKNVGVRMKIKRKYGDVQTDITISESSVYKFRATDYDNYYFCFGPSSQTQLPADASSHKPLMLSLKFEYGEDNAAHHHDTDRSSQITNLEQELKWVSDLSTQLLREQKRCLEISNMLEKLNRSTKLYIVTFVIIQLALVIVVALWQLRHLKAFIYAKKLV